MSDLIAEIRTVQPYRLLASGNVKSRTIFQSMSCTPFSTLPVALLRGDLFLAAVAAMAILSEVLIIAVSGVPFSAAEYHASFLISTYLSFAILGLMLVVLTGLPIWRRGKPYLPYESDTLFAVWSYLCASRMIEDLKDLARCESSVRDKRIINSRKRYFYGLSSGVDGVQRYAVDVVL